MADIKPLRINYERCHELFEVSKPCLLRVDKESGLRWKVCTSNRVKAGDWAGSISTSKHGHAKWYVFADSQRLNVARVIYFMSYGVDSYPLEIDHINVNSLYNAIENLRVSDKAIQMQNRKHNKNNTTGVRGVFWSTREKKYKVSIKVNRITHHLGTYSTLREAAEARWAGVLQYFSEDAWDANWIDIDAL
jgi:hypothetical protein